MTRAGFHKYGGVGYAERFRAKLQFCFAEHIEVLEERGVEVAERRSVELVPSFVAQCAEVLHGEGRGIEPLFDRGSIHRCAARHVRTVGARSSRPRSVDIGGVKHGKRVWAHR